MTSLGVDTEYVWRFYGASATTNGWSDPITFSTALTDAQKPVFTNSMVLSDDSIRLDWQDNASNETGYILQRSEALEGPYATIATIAADTTSYISDGLYFSTTYYYQLAATNTANSSATSFALCRTNATTTSTVFISSAVSVDEPDYNLTTTYGIGDWTYWIDTASPAVSGAPSNEKLGIDLIGSMSVIGSGVLRGSTATPVHDFVFTDGTSPVNGTALNVLGLFSDVLNVVGEGVQVNVISPVATPYNIYIWATSYQTTSATLTVTVNGKSDSDDTLSDTNRTPGRFYTIRVDPVAAGDMVSLQLVFSKGILGGSPSAHVIISAVAVDTAVPPPAGTVIIIR